MSPGIEIRGLDSLRKRFAAFGALKELQPSLRAEAETVAEEARAQLTERDPNSQLAQSIRIMALGQRINRPMRSGPTILQDFSWSSAPAECGPRPGLSQLCTAVYRLLTKLSERLSRRL